MDSIYGSTDPYANCFWPEVVPSDSHAVLYQLPLAHDGKPPIPRQSKSGWKWDQTHVRLPCSPESQYPVRKSNGSSEVVNRWELIETALLGRTITNSKDLELAIFSYNSKYAKSWNFQGLHAFFEDELSESESDLFFTAILPKIIQLALQLPTIVTSSIPLLKCGQNVSLSMTQQQIACLMANAFLCTFPRRNTQKMNSEYKHFPDINFNRLFYSTQPSVMEKLKCICHYFRRVTSKMPIGVVTFRRRSLAAKFIPRFDESFAELSNCKLFVTSTGTIEADGKGLLQVDFANKMIGGGVLGQGCVQEEIRFMICPELLITRLFTEVLRPDEALFIIGVEQFSLYSGYASSFEWAGNCNDETPLDGNQRRQCQIVAIDALPFKDPKHQFRSELMLRELTKAHVGFGRLQQQLRVAPGIASGNWGCGAFMGDTHLKSLLQLMVCAIAERPLVYFTFGDNQLVAELIDMHKFLCDKQVTVKRLWSILLKFSQLKSSNGDGLFDFVKKDFREGGRETKMLGLFKFTPRVPSVSKLANPAEDGNKKAVPLAAKEETEKDSKEMKKVQRDYSDTDDEAEVELERKKKLTPPVDNEGRQKQPKMSLADCLDSYFSKENPQNAPSTSRNAFNCSSSSSSLVSSVVPAASTVSVEDRNNNTTTPPPSPPEESNGSDSEHPAESIKPPIYDVVVQIDDEGEEFIEGTPPRKELPPQDSSYMGKQTKLIDFFKIRSNKK